MSADGVEVKKRSAQDIAADIQRAADESEGEWTLDLAKLEGEWDQKVMGCQRIYTEWLAHEKALRAVAAEYAERARRLASRAEHLKDRLANAHEFAGKGATQTVLGRAGWAKCTAHIEIEDEAAFVALYAGGMLIETAEGTAEVVQVVETTHKPIRSAIGAVLKRGIELPGVASVQGSSFRMK